jgi:hypothetical protein
VMAPHQPGPNAPDHENRRQKPVLDAIPALTRAHRNLFDVVTTRHEICERRRRPGLEAVLICAGRAISARISVMPRRSQPEVGTLLQGHFLHSGTFAHAFSVGAVRCTSFLRGITGADAPRPKRAATSRGYPDANHSSSRQQGWGS